MLVELKNGETLNGHLVNCDTWMNLTLKEVVQTSPVCLLPALRDKSYEVCYAGRRSTADDGDTPV